VEQQFLKVAICRARKLVTELNAVQSVFSNDPDRPVLVLALKVRLQEPIQVEPATDLRFPLRSGKGGAQVVMLLSFEPEPLRIVKIASSEPFVKAEMLAAGLAAAAGTLAWLLLFVALFFCLPVQAIDAARARPASASVA